MATVINAFALLAEDMPTARLVITGHAGDLAARERWHADGGNQESSAHIELAGLVSAERYRELLRTADLAVQRATSLR